MTTRELITRLRAIADEAAQSEATRPAAGVLYSLIGALVDSPAATVLLLRHVGKFSEAAIKRLSTHDN